MYYSINFFNDWEEDLKMLPNEDWCDDIKKTVSFWMDEKIDSLSMKTSGSSGPPKLISHPKHYIKKSAQRTITFFKLNNTSTILSSLPAKYVGGKMMIIRAIEAKCILLISKPTSNPLLHQSIQNVDLAAFTPLQMHEVINDPSSTNSLSNIRNTIIGGAPIAESTLLKLRDIKTNIYETFGMTETVSHIALKQICPNHESAFETLTGISISINSDQCLVISIDNGLKIETNDIVNFISENRFEWISRKDNIINSGGIKIQIKSLEERLSKFIDFPFFISKQKNDKYGELVCLVTLSINEKKLINFNFKTKIAKHEIPKKIILINDFIYTETNKLIRDLKQYNILKEISTSGK
jgi:O-succinylbenzoic acid--CoA ligase